MSSSPRFAAERLAALVRSKRGEKGLRETAKEIGGISASTLSRIERGKAPDLDTFFRLCDWLDVDPKVLMEGSHEQSGMTTPDKIEAHLRADRELDPDTAEAIAKLVRATYSAVVEGKLEAGSRMGKDD